MDNFLQIWIFGSKYRSKCDLQFKKKLLKKTKYWRRNRGFTFSPEVCLRSKKIFSALFSRNNIFLRRGHFKELQVKENLFNCPQIWTVASLTYKLQKRVELLISKYFFFESDFSTITPHFFNPISKKSCNFLLQLNMAKRRHVFLALWALKPRKKLNWRKTKFALTCSFRKVIRALAFSGHEKLDNSFYFKILGIV